MVFKKWDLQRLRIGVLDSPRMAPGLRVSERITYS